MNTHPQFVHAALEAARRALPSDKLGEPKCFMDYGEVHLYQVRLTSGHTFEVDLDANELVVYDSEYMEIFSSKFTITIELTK